MWSDLGQLLLALVIGLGLVLLIPRHVARAWAVWLLLCLVAISIQGIGQEMLNRYFPEEPPGPFRARTLLQQPGGFAGGVLLSALAILILVLRAGPTAATSAPAPARTAPGTGFSVLLFGLLILIGSLVEAISNRRQSINLLGVAVIASGWYLGRGSRLGAKWALLWMALIGVLDFLVLLLISFGENVNVMGKDIQPEDRTWALALGLALLVWAAVNVVLIIHFLMRSNPLADVS
jgi:hypothetical protein